MFRIKIQKIGRPIEQIIIKNNYFSAKFRRKLMNLGLRVHSHMLEYIAKNTTTFKEVPQSDAQPLIETIDFTEYQGEFGFGWGIGNIAVLNAQAKHWAIINYGGKHPQAGKQIPGEFTNSGVFAYASGSGKFISVGINTVILPMGYIEEARLYMDIQLINLILTMYK